MESKAIMNNDIEVLYSFTVPVFYSKTGEKERTYEYYWDAPLGEGGLRNAKTLRHTAIIKRVGGDDQMYVRSREEVLECIAILKRANHIQD